MKAWSSWRRGLPPLLLGLTSLGVVAIVALVWANQGPLRGLRAVDWAWLLAWSAVWLGSHLLALAATLPGLGRRLPCPACWPYVAAAVALGWVGPGLWSVGLYFLLLGLLDLFAALLWAPSGRMAALALFGALAESGLVVLLVQRF